MMFDDLWRKNAKASAEANGPPEVYGPIRCLDSLGGEIRVAEDAASRGGRGALFESLGRCFLHLADAANRAGMYPAALLLVARALRQVPPRASCTPPLLPWVQDQEANDDRRRLPRLQSRKDFARKRIAKG